jgi:hypothetical protein
LSRYANSKTSTPGWFAVTRPSTRRVNRAAYVKSYGFVPLLFLVLLTGAAVALRDGGPLAFALAFLGTALLTPVVVRRRESRRATPGSIGDASTRTSSGGNRSERPGDGVSPGARSAGEITSEHRKNGRRPPQ